MKIRGTKKADTLIGTKHDDEMRGGKGADYLGGSKGDDALYGGRGNDELFGGAGTDVMKGGKGKDTFYVNADSFDSITDFHPAKDRIIFDDLDGQLDKPPIDYASLFSFDGGTLLYEGAPIVQVTPFEIGVDNSLLLF